MTIALEGVQTTFVPMTPDKSVQWEKIPMDHMGGDMYLAPGCPAKIARNVLSMALSGSEEFNGARPIGSGRYGRVVEQDGVAYKRSFGLQKETALGLPGLQANLVLRHGFGLITGRAEPPRLPDGTIVDYVYDTPEFYGTFLPDPRSSLAIRNSKQLWAMSYEDGSTPLPFEIPCGEDRSGRYKDAVLEAGLHTETQIFFDDKLENLILVGSPDSPGSRLVKLDVMAEDDFSLAL